MLDRLLCLFFVFAIVVTASDAQAQRQDDAPIPFVFTQPIEDARFDGQVLEVSGVGEATPYLSDRPERTLKGETKNPAFAKAWDAPGSQGVEATLNLEDGSTIALRLLSATFEKTVFRYNVESESSIPSQFGSATMEIYLNGCITGCSELCPFNFSRVFFNKLVPCKS